MDKFRNSILTLITDTSTNLPPDVRRAVIEASKKETPGTRSSLALETIATNIDMACDLSGAICQDTGMPTFYIHTPVGANQLWMKKEILDSVAEATRLGTLRENSVDSLTGKNSGNNLGPGTPVVHWEQWENDDEIEVKLILKGGGCENKNIQYSLPSDLDHLGTGKILGVGFVHHVTFAGDLEHKLVVGLLLGMANLLDQCDNIAPFEIMRRRVMEYRFERATAPPCYG